MIRALAIGLGRLLKGDVFTIDPDLPLSAIARFAAARMVAALRGLLARPFLAAGSGSPAFIGTGVRLRTRRRIRIGRGATIGDHVLIEGLSRHGVEIGPGASIGAHSIIIPTSVMRNMGEGCTIGTNSGIGQFSFIGCGGGVRIGRDVIMGQYVSFHTENHLHADLERPIIAQGVRRAPVEIGDDCWVGVKATFLSGAKVGRGCIVAAGAVVRGEIPPYSIVGGVPARIIGTRREGDPLPPAAPGDTAAGPDLAAATTAADADGSARPEPPGRPALPRILLMLLGVAVAASLAVARLIAEPNPYASDLTASPPTPLALAGINLSGAEYPSASMAKWGTREVYPNPEVIDYFAGLGMNIIRLPLNWQRLQPEMCGPLAPGSLAKIDEVLRLARARGLTVILDLHEFGFAYGRLIGANDRGAECFADFWRRMAERYRGDDKIMLGLMNEPHFQTAADWLPPTNRAIAAIRAAGSRQAILVSGSHWDDAENWTTTDNAADLGEKIVDPGNNHLIELHYYFNPWTGPRQRAKSIDQGPQAFAAVTRWARARKVRLFLGETGVAADPTSLSALDRLLTFLERNTDVWSGYTYFAFGGGPAPFSVYIDQRAPSPQTEVMMRHLPHAAPGR